MVKVDCNTKKELSWNPSIDKFLHELVKQNTEMFNNKPRVNWNYIFLTYQGLWESLGLNKTQQLQYRSRTQAHLSARSSSSLSGFSSLTMTETQTNELVSCFYTVTAGFCLNQAIPKALDK